MTYGLGRDLRPSAGPLAGLRVLEFAGLGAVPFCGMMLADMGAEVVRVDRPPATRSLEREVPGHDPGSPHGLLDRGRASIALDLKQPAAVDIALRLVARSDVLIEGFRPGVMERLGLGPDVCLARNPALVYGRLTGWGQDGPLAHASGHDVNYLAVAGALHPLGHPDTVPTPPLNLLGDLAAGGMLLTSGVLAALVAASRTGRGQTVDAAMVDGAALLTTQLHGWRAAGLLAARGQNDIDGGAPFYGVYRTADDRFVAVGAGEPVFYERLLAVLGLDPTQLPPRSDRTQWPRLRAEFEMRFAAHTREYWCRAFEGVDACFAPVLEPAEAPGHPHLAARGTFISPGGLEQPAPAPRFHGTPAGDPGIPPVIGAHSEAVLRGLGLREPEIARLRDAGAVATAETSARRPGRTGRSRGA